MALTRITKGVIKPNENYDTHNINSTGIITAIGFKGPFTGSSDIQSGIITATQLDLNGDLDVDGHTNLDNVSIAGVVTATTINATTFAGAISGTTGTFSGNVSIGGTLTYEDVTNIDAVGLITARGGVNISDTTQSTSTTTGALKVAGGAGIVKNLNVGGTSTFAGTSTFNDDATFTGATSGRNVFFDKSENSLEFGDYTYAKFGGSDDLTIFHSTSPEASLINNKTGELRIVSSGTIRIGKRHDATGAYAANMIVATPDGSVELHNNNSKKLATYSGGVAISGDATSAILRFNDTDGNVNYQIAGYDGNRMIIMDGTGGTVLDLREDGTNIFCKNSLRFDVDNLEVSLGAGTDFKILHTGSANVFDASTSNPFSFKFGGTEKASFNSSGVFDINNAAGQSHYQITQASGNTVKFGIVSGSDIELSGSSNNSMYFKTNNTERLRITSGGAIGINTSVPSTNQDLTFDGASNYKAGILYKQAGVNQYRFMCEGGTGHVYYDTFVNDRDHVFRVDSQSTGGTPVFRIGGDGKVSVGTEQTTHTFGVTGGSSSQLLVKGGEADIWMHSTGPSGGGVWRILGSTGGSTHQFRIYDNTGGADRLVIDSQGRLSCGPGAETGSLSSSLHVRRNSGGTAAGESVIAATCGDNTTMISALLTVRNAGNRGSKGHGSGSKLASFEFNDHKALTITKDGRVGIGTDSATGTLEVVDTGEYQLILKDNNNAGPGAEMAMGFKDSANTIQGYVGFNRWEDDDFHIANQNSGGHITFKTHNGSAVGERLRIQSNGITGINTSDGRFNNSNSASANKFYQNDMKLGLHGSIAIGNLSSTATDIRELAFYRRGGPTPGTAISNHHMGRVAWYGSSNDSAFPDMAWSLDCTANGGGWTAGSNRHGYLSFVSGRSGELIRIKHDAKVSIGFAGAPTSRVHIKGNSDNGAEDATVTIDDTDTTAGSKEPILAFDGGGTRQARIMSSDQTSTGAGGLYFAVGSSNTTALQLTAQRYTKIHSDVRAWSTVEYNNIRTHQRMHYAPGNAVSTYTILRIRRHWWGWGHYKIRCKAIYYNSSLESTWFVNGHGSGGNSYTISNETYGGDASSQSWGCTVTHTASNNSPGSSGTWYADIQVNIPNYYYVTIWVEAWGSSYTTDPTTGVANSINTYCLM